MSAVAMPVMVGATGLALDSVQWMLWQRQLQQVADAGAIAGAYAWAQGDDVVKAAKFAVDEDEHIALTGTPSVTPATVNNQRRVTVSVSAQKKLPFSGMFMSAPPTLSRTSTAALLQDGNFCVLALGQYNGTGISAQGNTSVSLGCGMASNSDGDNSIQAVGSSQLRANPFMAVGGITGGSSRLISNSPPQPFSLPMNDPYAGRDDPTPPSPCTNPQGTSSFNVNRQDMTLQLKPGCFSGGLELKGEGTINLDPGIYYVDGGVLSFGSQVTVNGAGVVFVLTTTTGGSVATLNINAGATLNLSAPAADATGELANYRNILIFQDRRAASGITSRINGHASLSLDGSIYMPKQHLEYSGTSGTGTKCVQIVTDSITFTGNSSLGNNCANSPKNFRGTIVRLIA